MQEPQLWPLLVASKHGEKVDWEKVTQLKLTGRSLERLAGVNPALVSVVTRAAELIDEMYPELGFIVTEGLRSPERQARLVEAGASQTMRSKHLTGHAVDLAAVIDGDVRWDWPLYYQLADVMKRAAKEANVNLEWGGDWTSFKDGPHFQLGTPIYRA